MFIQKFALVACMLGLIAGPALAEPTDDLTATVEQLISGKDGLASESFKARQAAEQALIKIGPNALDLIKAQAKTNEDPEVQIRLERVVASIEALTKSGGTIVNGLKYCLTASHDTLSLKQKIRLTTTLVNTTDKDMTVRVGYSTIGNYFESASALRLRRITGESEESRKLERPQMLVGFCGTGAYPLNVIIKAHQSQCFTTDIALVPADPKVQQANETRPFAMMFANNNYYRAATTGSETLDVLMRLELSQEAARSTGMGEAGQVTANGNFWHGEIQSNAVKLNINKDYDPDQQLIQTDEIFIGCEG